MARFDPLVSKVVVPVPKVRWIVVIADALTVRALVAIVYVVPVPPEPWSRVTLPENSVPDPHREPQKVIVCAASALNVIGAAKDHDEDCEVFVHAPVTVHEPPAVELIQLVELAMCTTPPAFTLTVLPPATKPDTLALGV